MLPVACRKNKLKAAAFFFVVMFLMVGILIGVIACLVWLQMSGLLLQFLNWVQEQKIIGNIIMGIILAVLNLPLTMGYVIIVTACGLFYGFWQGLLTVIIGSFVGWFGSFIIMRYFLYEKASTYIHEKGGYIAQAMMKELGFRQKTMATLIRVGPIPPGLQTALLAVSPVSTPVYIWTSFVGLLLKQIPLTFVGAGAQNLLQTTGESPEQSGHKILFVLGAVGAVLLFAFGFYVSKKAYNSAKKLQLEEQENMGIVGLEMELLGDDENEYVDEEAGDDSDVREDDGQIEMKYAIEDESSFLTFSQ